MVFKTHPSFSVVCPLICLRPQPLPADAPGGLLLQLEHHALTPEQPNGPLYPTQISAK